MVHRAEPPSRARRGRWGERRPEANRPAIARALMGYACALSLTHGVCAAQTAYDPSLGAFPRSVLSNGVALFARGNIVPLLLGSGLTAAARAADQDVQAAVADNATAIGDAGDILGNGFVVLGGVSTLFAVGQLGSNGGFRSVTFDLAQGVVINAVLTTTLKRTFRRTRPDSSNAHSFPSGHTSTSFTIVTVLARHFGPKAAIPAAVAATFIGVSRIEDNEHFAADVVAGATLGFLVGRAATAHLGSPPNPVPPRASVSPLFVPDGAGVLFVVRF